MIVCDPMSDLRRTDHLFGRAASNATSAYSLNLDGTDDYVSVAGSLTGGAGSTWSAWVKLMAAGNFPMAMSAREVAAGNLIELRFSGGTRKPQFSYSANSALSPDALPLNEWHLITGTANGTTLRIYVDGVEKGSTGSAFASSNQPINFGRRISGGLHLAGFLDDIRVYNRQLSTAEVASLFAAAHIATGLVGHWKLEEGSGESAADSSGSGLTGTLLPSGIGPTWSTDRASVFQ